VVVGCDPFLQAEAPDDIPDSGETPVAADDSTAILVKIAEVPVAKPVPVGPYAEVLLPILYIPPVGAITFPVPFPNPFPFPFPEGLKWWRFLPE
jgi:hypothetical protein